MVLVEVLLVLLSGLFQGSTINATRSSASSGIAVYYAPGVFAEVARNRGMRLRDDVDGYAAVNNCGYVGRTAYASIYGDDVETFQILDCSAPEDRARHQRRGVVIEVDYQSAVRHGFVSRGSAPAVLTRIK